MISQHPFNTNSGTTQMQIDQILERVNQRLTKNA